MTLWEIFEKVKAENARSKEKYGFWRHRSDTEQKEAIEGEFKEWQDAYYSSDVDGPHGEVAEALQVINCMVRRIQHLTEEADA